MPTLYRRRQFGTLVVVVLAAAIALIVIQSAHLGWHPATIAVTAILAACLALFHSLTVEVDGERLLLRFGVGLVARRIPLAEIRGAAPVRNAWYYGWGVRSTPHGWLYNVSGLDAVELSLAGGRRVRIGTDRPRELAAAVSAALDAASRGR